MNHVPLSLELIRALQAARASIPAEVRRKVRLHVADSVGIAVAAQNTSLAVSVAKAQLAASGPGSSPLLSGGNASPLAAAYINAALVHILDYDDIHDVGRLHPSAVVLPAVLAVSSLTDVTDEDFLDAVALGSELICRLGKVCAPEGEGPGAEWFLTQLFGYVAASVAAGISLGLTAEQQVSAMGLAYMQAAGGKQAGFGTGANARAVYPAFAAQGGVQAALLAREGLVGPEGALDGAAGLFKIYMGGQLSSSQRSALLDLSEWHFLDVDSKPWPTCRLSHPYIAVALAARDEVGEAPEGNIRLAVNASAARLCRPLEQRRQPRTLQDAKYSIPFMTAYTLVHGAPMLNTFDDNVLNDERVLGVAARIELDETLPDNPGHPLAVLTLSDDDSSAMPRTYRFQLDNVRMDEASIYAKFNSCLTHVGLGDHVQQVWQGLTQGDALAQLRKLCTAQVADDDSQASVPAATA